MSGTAQAKSPSLIQELVNYSKSGETNEYLNLFLTAEKISNGVITLSSLGEKNVSAVLYCPPTGMDANLQMHLNYAGEDVVDSKLNFVLKLRDIGCGEAMKKMAAGYTGTMYQFTVRNKTVETVQRLQDQEENIHTKLNLNP